VILAAGWLLEKRVAQNHRFKPFQEGYRASMEVQILPGDPASLESNTRLSEPWLLGDNFDTFL
jgi:hypothetical protein